MAVVVLLDTLGVHVDPRISTGHTPLMMAAMLGRTRILELLLKSGANVNLEDDKKWTPLFWAVSNGREKAVELLLKESKTGVDHQDKYGRTPFSLAAEHSFIRIMNLLINHGGDPHIPDGEGHTGFWWFLKVRHDLCIRSPSTSIQPRQGGTVNPFLLPLLIWSLPSPDRKDQSGRSWLSWAAEYGDEQVLEYFIERGGPVDFNVCDGNKVLSRTPLIWALERKNTGVIDLLKSHDLVSLHFLVEGISSIKEEHTLGLVMTLLQANYNPNQTDKNNRTPLHIACLKRDLRLVSALIEHNADTSLEDNNGKTPLEYALNRQSQEIINLLLGATKDIPSMQSIEWFEGLNSPSWIQLTRRSEITGYILQSVNTVGICEKSFTWSSLPHMLGISDADCKKPCYWNFARKDHDHEFMNYISVDFPGEHAMETSPWGIAWTQKEMANGCAKGFISKLPTMRVPNGFLDFFHSFLETWQDEWRKKCAHTNAKAEKLEREQLENYGKNHDLFENLAKNALEVTNLRQCLQSHIEGIINMLECDLSFEPNRDTRAKIAEVRLEVTAKIDKMEQAVRSAMQTELSLISRNEAASFKRLSWVT
ncbi:hypothetical protein N8T08_003904 [Aspergillus melleus]|uniref:Uncharacterized protein n=1 Tax=Aspergillus melleus TaxID=138277 RepID=A0ACC3B605_9EURO|nr:hypothetical protein N8T08_003904 [Aspergillus melleus]